MSLRSEDDLDRMTNAELLEVWKSTFGLKSSAAVLQTLNGVTFRGDSLAPAAWAGFHQRFILVTAQAPSAVLPPPKTLAKKFVSACPSTFLRLDILALEPVDVTSALSLIISRLNDVNVLHEPLLQLELRLHGRNDGPRARVNWCRWRLKTMASSIWIT
jgi:hypothetical protein